jgi:hypothetical protein
MRVVRSKKMRSLQLMRVGVFVAAALLAFQTSGVLGSTVAYWRFEEGPADALVPHGGLADGEFYLGIADSSGNGNGLSVFQEGWAGYVYRTDRPAGTVPQTNATNSFSVQNSGNYPVLFTQSGTAMQTMAPAAWTIEASYKPRVDGYRTVVGRDSLGSRTDGGDAKVSALYLQARSNNAVAIMFCDVSGYWHEAVSAADLLKGFSSESGYDGRWYHMAAVSDGVTLSLYLDDVNAGTGYQLVAQTDMSTSGSPNTALTAGTGSGSGWTAGSWTVGRGLYDGNHVDRAFGFIDEVRISDEALPSSQFLFAQTFMTLAPYTSTVATVDTTAMTLVIPSSCNASQNVDVTVTSDNPAVVKPTGSTGSKVVSFTSGGANYATVSMELGSAGQANLTLSATGCTAGPAPAATVTVEAVESVALQVAADVMKVGLTQQANVIGSFGTAGTRDVSAASFGTTYAAVPSGVVDIGPDGLITAVGLGTATVTATLGGISSPGQVIAVLPGDHTVAYWRFEQGPADAQVSHGGQAAGTFYPGALDSSGNGNALSVWAEGWGGYAYRADVASSTISKTEAANNFSVQNTGSYPAMFTGSDAMRTMAPAAWTIEASFKPEAKGWRTIVGRDSKGSRTDGGDANVSALYFQIQPDDSVAIQFCDVSGYWHIAKSDGGLIQGFTAPNADQGHWYHMAAVSDGSMLSLYLNDVGAGTGYELVAHTDMSTSGSPNTALTAGTGSGGDWQAGNWSVGRGLYNGAHIDRAYGFIDEVRISDVALDPSQFLFTPDYVVLWPSTISAAAGDPATNASVVVIPANCNESQAVDVTVTSDNPAVAKPAGSEGSAVVHFDAGAGRLQVVPIEFGTAGVAKFTVLATGGCPAIPGTSTTVTVYTAQSVELQFVYDLMKIGQSHQARVVADFGGAGTRDVTTGAYGTTYGAVPSGVLSVSGDGLVTGAGLGTATLTATCGGITSSGKTVTVATPNPRVKVAGSGVLLVDLSALDATAGQSVWVNKGSLGNFAMVGQPVLGTVAGETAVSFDGSSAYQGPLAPSELLGGQGRTIEVWAYQPAIEASPAIETMVAWGHRGGPANTNVAFGFGDHAEWGAFAGWYAAGDMSWNPYGAGSPPLGEWRYLVYTFDPNDSDGMQRIYDNAAEVNYEVSGPMPTHPGYINLAAQNKSEAPLDLYAAEMGSLGLAVVRVHDGALTPAEIKSNYLLGITGKGQVPPDLDLNTHVDTDDAVIFAGCARGPAVPLTEDCAMVDFDGDGDGDQNDFSIYQRCYTGPVLTASADCMP